jgi:hypothetical protein
MSNRTAKFVSAIFASLLAGTPLATVSHSAAAECLSGPKDQTPEGSHWHYRIEHPSERHCWYLRKEDGQVSQLAAPDSPTPAKPVQPKTDPAMQRSIADARAEVPQEKAATAMQPVPATAGTENTVWGNAGAVNSETSTIASRWPGQLDAGSLVNPPPVSPQSSAASPVASPAASPAASAPSDSKMAAPRAVAAVTLAAADSSSKSPSSKSSFSSIQMLLTIAMGALSLALGQGGALFRFGRTRWTGERDESRPHRRVNWGSHGAGDLTRSAYRNANMPEGHIPRDPRAADDPDRRIAEMLARLSRSAAA